MRDDQGSLFGEIGGLFGPEMVECTHPDEVRLALIDTTAERSAIEMAEFAARGLLGDDNPPHPAAVSCEHCGVAILPLPHGDDPTRWYAEASYYLHHEFCTDQHVTRDGIRHAPPGGNPDDFPTGGGSPAAAGPDPAAVRAMFEGLGWSTTTPPPLRNSAL